jgi:site-specific DNA-cytosine methylase
MPPKDAGPINTDEDGCSATITAGYFKYGSATLLGGNYGTSGTAVVEPVVLGWVRDEKGNVVKRPPVEVANTVTSGKRDNTQNYVVEPRCHVVAKLDIPGKHESCCRVHGVDGVAPTQNCCEGGGLETKIMEPVTYRIRKLTERECFRLMDVPEEYIDRIQAAGISRSQQYKMAGNSIVVACMYHLFRKLWIDTQIKTLTLF